jgi:osmoprotectant transport system permease protein
VINLRKKYFMCCLSLLVGVIISTHLHAKQTSKVTIGSKTFTESVILGEIIAGIGTSQGITVQHRRQLGGTRILWNALLQGEIDIYPEYTGTLLREIFAGQNIPDQVALKTVLATHGLRMTAPLGFNNTYVLGMRADRAKALGIERISDLRRHSGLDFGFSNEFMDRSDGWPGLKRHYRLPQKQVRGLDHDLSYRGLNAGDLDVIDLYATDAEIAYYQITVLHDDAGYFPSYQAVVLYRAELNEHHPELVASIERLADTIDSATMISLNAAVKLSQRKERDAAADFLRDHLSLSLGYSVDNPWTELWRHTRAHLFLVAVSLSVAIILAIPLGILAFRRPRLGQVILAATGIIQTIPALALLVFMIPLLGIGGPPAIVALFLYSLLPIVRNTYAGLHDIPRELRESAEALGLPEYARLRLIEIPMASRAILAGIKTSAVINVGTATLGALIGAGGYGQPILTGIRLDDMGLILQGAVPAAFLALAVQAIFEISERFVVPRGLRLKRAISH